MPCAGDNINSNATDIYPTAVPALVESFRRQFWHPLLSVSGVVSDTPDGKHMAAAVLRHTDDEPYSGADGSVTMMTQEDRMLVVKIDMDLSAYPFDQQIVDINFKPPLSNPIHRFQMEAHVTDDAVNAFQSSVDVGTEDFTDVVGDTVSGMSITG